MSPYLNNILIAQLMLLSKKYNILLGNLKGTGHFFETLSVDIVPDTDHS